MSIARPNRSVSMLLVAVCAAWTAVAGSASGQCPVLAGRNGFGPTWDLAVADGIVFAGSGSVLVAAEAVSGTERGRVDVGGVIHGVTVSGGRAYVAADGQGLVVVDVTDPASMRVLGTGVGAPVSLGVAVSGDTAAVAAGWTGLVLFDVSDPASPRRVGVSSAGAYALAVALSGRVAAVGESVGGVRLVDVSDPSDPVELATVDTAGEAGGLAFSGDTLYATDSQEGLVVLDVADPSNPVRLGAVSLPGFPEDVAVSGTTAWVAADYGDLVFVDVANASAPSVLSVLPIDSGVAVAVAVDGTAGWVALHAGGAVRVDASTPSAPSEGARLAAHGEVRAVAGVGDHAVVADWSGARLRIIDPAAGGGPAEVASVELPGTAAALAVSGGKAYVALDWFGLVVVDLDDPLHPVIEGSVALPGHPSGVALAGSHVLVPCSGAGLEVVDVTDPASPSVAGELELSGSLFGVGVVGDTAYVAAGGDGVVVVDVSDPIHPSRVGAASTRGTALDVAPFGDRLAVADYYGGLTVMDVSAPQTPVVEGHLDLPDATRSVSVRNGLAFAGNSLQGLTVIDLSDPASPAARGFVEVPGDSWGGAFVGNLYALAEGQGGVAFFDVSGCGSGPAAPVADFSFRPSAPKTGETVSFTDLSTGSPTSWHWDFGDGSASTERNPTHVYTSSGTFGVTLEVANGSGSDSVTRTIVVHPVGELPPIHFPFAHRYVVAAAAHVPGAAGTNWVTDLVLHNPGTEDAIVDVFFLETGKDNSAAQPSEFTVPAESSVRFPDVLASPFGLGHATGALYIGSDRPLVVSSRTFNDAAEGTFGQFIPGPDLSRSLGTSETAILVQLEEAADSSRGFRTNFGVANVSGVPIHVVVDGYAADGARLGSVGLDVPAWSHVQINRILSSRLGAPAADDAYLVARTDTEGACWFAYASVVDNRSGDPTYVAPADDWEGPVWIAAAAHAEGYNGTVWRTAVEVCAFSGTLDDVTLRWAEDGASSPRETSLGGVPGNCRRFGDILADAFSANGTGALAFTAGQGRLTVGSRTFNDAGDRTYGQSIPAVPASAAFPWGTTARLVQLAHSADRSRGFRTNIGMVNVGDVAVTLRLELRSGDGGSLGVKTVRLAAGEHRQLNDVFREFTESSVDDAYALIAATTGPASWLAYASVVDNRSGDPVFIPAVATD